MNIFSLTKKSFRFFTDRIPTKLPVGDPEFEVWAKSIIDYYGFPDNDSGRWALCGMIMALAPTTFYKPKRYFGLAGLKSLSNQTCHAIMLDIQDRDKAKRAADEAAKAAANGLNKPVEAMTLTVVNGQSK